MKMKKVIKNTKSVKSVKAVKSSKKVVSQIEKLSNYLTKHGKITRTKAVSLGITSVSGAIAKLKNRGMNIQSSLKSVKGKTFATYTLGK